MSNTITKQEVEDLFTPILGCGLHGNDCPAYEVKDVYEMDEKEFKSELTRRTTPCDVYANASNIYEFLRQVFRQNCYDSLLREWSFQWVTEKTGLDYDEIYKKWLGMA